jgi:hypothetical protein
MTVNSAPVVDEVLEIIAVAVFYAFCIELEPEIPKSHDYRRKRFYFFIFYFFF